MLTEREKEIAQNCFDVFMGADEDEFNVNDMFDLFLSRIREEQEAFAVLQRGNNTFIECIYKGLLTPIDPSALMEADRIDRFTSIKLFTTPPAAPDCSELVKALEFYANPDNWFGFDDGYFRILKDKRHGDIIAQDALANHAKRMKGEE